MVLEPMKLGKAKPCGALSSYEEPSFQSSFYIVGFLFSGRRIYILVQHSTCFWLATDLANAARKCRRKCSPWEQINETNKMGIERSMV